MDGVTLKLLVLGPEFVHGIWCRLLETVIQVLVETDRFLVTQPGFAGHQEVGNHRRRVGLASPVIQEVELDLLEMQPALLVGVLARLPDPGDADHRAREDVHGDGALRCRQGKVILVAGKVEQVPRRQLLGHPQLLADLLVVVVGQVIAIGDHTAGADPVVPLVVDELVDDRLLALRIAGIALVQVEECLIVIHKLLGLLLGRVTDHGRELLAFTPQVTNRRRLEGQLILLHQ